MSKSPVHRSSKYGSLFLTFSVIFAVVVVGAALLRQEQTVRAGHPVPDFTVNTFDGETVSLDSLRGQIVVLNFWASWCAPCRDEAPELQYIHETYSQYGVVMLGITYAESSDQNSINFIEEFGLTYPNGPDTGTRISRRYGITGVPETFIIDRDGNLAPGGYFPGPVNALDIIDVLDVLLASDDA